MLEDHWYIICRSNELRKKPLSRKLFGLHLVLYRDTTSQPGILEDRCRHRNAPLSKGKVCADTLVCPYHGWSYNTDGSIAEIPALSTADKSDYPSGINSYRCVEQQGYIWVCPGHNNELANKYTTALPPLFPNLHTPGWLSFRMKTRFKASVEACLENFLDCPHANHVHKGWFRTPSNKKVNVTVRTLQDGAEAEYFEEPRKASVVWSLLSSKKSQMKHTDRFIAPATSRVDYDFNNGLHYTITSSCSPVNHNETEVYTVITFKIKWFAHLVRLYFKPLAKLIIKQDVDILQLQTDNVKKFGGPQFAVMPTDLLYDSIHQWRHAIKHGEEPPQAGEVKNLDIYI